MRSIASTRRAVNCALFVPEDKSVKDKTQVLRCCLDDPFREYYTIMDMCGTVACPFFKPVGKDNCIRKEKGKDVWFEEIPENVRKHQMTPMEYAKGYEGKRK